MKVLHVIQTLSARFGGPVASLKALSQHQSHSGMDVTICTTNADYPKGYLPVATGKPVLERGVKIWFHQVLFQPLLVSPAFKNWMDHTIKAFNIVHVHGLYRFPVTYAARAARKAVVPHVITPHGALDPFLYTQSRYSVFIKRLYERLFDFPNMRHASAINYTTQEELLRTKFLNLRAPTAVVPNGIDWHQYDQLPQRGSFRDSIGVDMAAPLVLFLGRINFKKGLDLLIPAFSIASNTLPKARLAIVGPDNEGLGRDVRKWCSAHGIENRVSIIDHQNREQVRQTYVDADLYVLPSYTENFGLTVIEAMACRCPVVISNQVNIWPEVKQAGAGKVVNLEPQEISDAMLSILGNKHIAKCMGEAGRKLARSYAYEHVADQIKQMYETIISNGHHK